jgi:hypothetical protein
MYPLYSANFALGNFQHGQIEKNRKLYDKLFEYLNIRRVYQNVERIFQNSNLDLSCITTR